MNVQLEAVAGHPEDGVLGANTYIKPLPVPDLAMTSVNVEGFTTKVAPTVTLLPSFTVQLPVPLHAPDHPVNVDPVAGVAVRVSWVPEG